MSGSEGAHPTFRVAAGAVARLYAARPGRPPRLVAVEIAGRRVPVACRSGSLVVDGSTVETDDLALVGTVAVDATTGALGWTAADSATATVLTVEVAADGAGRGIVRTTWSVRGSGRLGRAVAEAWDRPSARGPAVSDQPAPADLGQPLFGEGWFVGLEHPGAENAVPVPVSAADSAGGVVLAIPTDVRLHPDRPFTLPAVVLGGAEVGEELDAFWDYLDAVRARPAGLVVLANNWYQLGAVGRMDEATVTGELAGFDAVAERHGLVLDHYCLDDPWDGQWEPPTGLWGRLDPGRFPGGLGALAGVAGTPGRVGLWVSPWGGYYERKERRVEWGRTQGYEAYDAGWPLLCPAGDVYGSHLAEALERWSAAGVGYWKLDGVQFNCPISDHGHAVGPGGRTEQMDRFASVLDRVHAANPAAVAAFTTGSNPSPWWLLHADFLWRGGLDDDAPAEFDGPPAERFDTYIDSCLDALRATALPVSSIVTFSLVENQTRAYREADSAADAWARHCWLLAGRGNLHHDLYVGPDSLTAGEWDVLAEVLRWVEGHQRELGRSRMVGGRPQAGEAYGFVGHLDGRVAGCLRNPSATPRTIDGSERGLGTGLDEVAVAWGRSSVAALLGGPVGPENEPVELEPFEVVVFSGRGRPRTRRDRSG